jgi:L-alanine-DL-glutamate epimerase-like enolase superfamily enzyme
MKEESAGRLIGRREVLHTTAAALAAASLVDRDVATALQFTKTASRPSDLRITDLRVAVVARAPMTCPILRIDTNQGISGFGEVRDGASKTYALMLKSRLVGENPCNVDRIFRKIKQFGFHARQGGGVSGVEVALWDLAGKAYGVPVCQMLGGKFRDRVRCYADTDSSRDPKAFAARLKERMNRGFTFLKMDLGINLLQGIPGALTRPLGQTDAEVSTTEHMFTGIDITPKGIEVLADYVAQVREVIGMEIPLAADHFGHIGVEDIYLKEGFLGLAKNHAVDMIQPDLLTAGGILETKKIGDACQELGVPMVLHMAGTPIACMAAVHCAAATQNFLVMENHSVDVPWWGDMVNGVEKPVVDKGYINVPEGPGLGITSLNDEVIKQHLMEPGYFEPTPEWDKERSNDRLWS